MAAANGVQEQGVRTFILLLIGLSTALLPGCRPAPESEPYRPAFVAAPPEGAQTLIFGVHPMHSPHRLSQIYQPLVDLLNQRHPELRVRLEASQDYADFESKLSRRHFAFALPNPYQTVMSRQHGYRVFAKMGDDDKFRGIILLRKDSRVREPRDLVGKRVSFPAPTALVATVLPQWFLHQAGLDVLRDLDNRYVGSQESSIMNVYLGKTAAGATWPAPWQTFQRERPDIAAQLVVKWQTPPLVNYGLVVRDDIPAELVGRVQAVLLELERSEEGRAILAPMDVSRFEPADDRRYQAVADFIQRFEREVRPIKESR